MASNTDKEPILAETVTTGGESTSSANYGLRNAVNSSRLRKASAGGVHYEELMEGSVPCPSCQGLGRVPRELEGQLVAIIPMNDKRLAPRRTILWVGIAVVLCALLGGLLLFFLLPRSIVLSTTERNLTPIVLDDEGAWEHQIFATIAPRLNVTNNNFYAVNVVSVTGVATADDFSSTDVQLGHAENVTLLSVPLRSTMSLALFMNVTIGKYLDNLYYQCVYAKWIYVRFSYTISIEYLGHGEQDTLQIAQKVCCDKNATICGGM